MGAGFPPKNDDRLFGVCAISLSLLIGDDGRGLICALGIVLLCKLAGKPGSQPSLAWAT